MRDRISRPHLITIRPLNPQSPDVFGDAPVIAANNRKSAFDMKAQVTYTSRSVFESGSPGRESNVKAIAMIRKRDIPPDAPDGWVPSSNDIFELVDGDPLFVFDVQPAFPRRISTRTRGGFDGWRVHLTDRNPTMRSANQY